MSKIVLPGNAYVVARRDGVLLDARPDRCCAQLYTTSAQYQSGVRVYLGPTAPAPLSSRWPGHETPRAGRRSLPPAVARLLLATR